MQMIIGFATTNTHKLQETQECFSMLDPSIRVVSLPPSRDVEEVGATFSENARIKLEAALAESIPPEVDYVVAEDSGLIIDALDGRYGISPFPGIVSDRWFSPDVQHELMGTVIEHPTYTEKNQGILKLMVLETNRTARYETWVACWSRQINSIFSDHGTVPLMVATAPRGQNGFGYDPIMIPVVYDANRTMAELSSEEKNQISHRRQAMARLLDQIR